MAKLHQNHVDEGFCSSISPEPYNAWCNDQADHEGVHWAVLLESKSEETKKIRWVDNKLLG